MERDTAAERAAWVKASVEKMRLTEDQPQALNDLLTIFDTSLSWQVQMDAAMRLHRRRHPRPDGD